MQPFFLLFALAAGVVSVLQSGSNNTLQKGLGAPLWTVAIVCAVTLVAATVLPLVTGEPLPAGQAAAQVRWWAWIGGLFGLVFVLATVYASPRLGAGLFVALVVTASTVTSLVLDHFGLMGFETHRAGVGRVVGALLMVAGVASIAMF